MPDYTLDEWRKLAQVKLDAQIARAQHYQRYYDGEHKVLALMDTQERNTFRKYLAEARANWCELVVNAVAERLQVVGFRFGGTGADDNAWTIWQASSMDADGELVQTDALVTGQAFALVQPDEDNPTGVEITGESPFEATVLYEPGNRRRRAAGYKRFADGTTVVETVILPDRIATWHGGGGPVVERNPALDARSGGFVQLVEMRPQPRTILPGRSEMHAAITFQDRINTTIFNRLVATDYGAFRQIWATGVKLAREVLRDEEGNPTAERVVKPYDVGANRLLTNENPDGHFGAFAESTLAGYLNSVAQDVEQLAAVTQTPPHYLLGQMVNISADAIKAAEAGLVSKVSRRALHIGEAWEETMRLALSFVGDPASVNVSAEVIWKDFETRSDAQVADALTKLATLGVPQEVLWEKLGASPQEIERWRQLKTTETVTAAQAQATALGAVDPYAQALAGQNSGGGGPGPG